MTGTSTSTTTDDAQVADVADISGLGPLVRPNLLQVEGFRSWALSRGTYQREDLLPRDAYLALTPRERRRYNRRRDAANSNIDILETPMGTALSEALEDGIWINAVNRQPGAKPGFMVNGGGAQGKTATVLDVVANFLEEWLAEHRIETTPGGQRNAHEPVVYVRTPDKPTPKALCQAVLRAVGEPFLKGDPFPDLQRQVHDVLVSLGVRVLILDDITRIKMHRLDDQDVLDLIRSLMDSGATLILIGVGIPRSGLLREGGPVEDVADRHVHLEAGTARLRRRAVEDDDEATQTERRFTLLHLRNFSYDTPQDVDDWTTFLTGVGHQLRLYGVDHTTLLADGLPEYLFRRTGGVVGSVVQLVSRGARTAMRHPDPVTGDELITREILDQEVIDFAGEDGRLPEAGEVPAVPAHRPAAARRKGRNTVLDDKHGRRQATAG